MRQFIVVCCIAVLGGCANQQQIVANQAAMAEQQQQAEIAYTRGLASQCENIGYVRDTDPWRNCIIQLHGQNQARSSALQGAVLQQYLQQQYQQLPFCSSLPPFQAGYRRSQGTCR